MAAAPIETGIPLTTYQDVLRAYPELATKAEPEYVEELIAKAARLLRSLSPGVDRCIDAGRLDPFFVQDKLIEAVLRVIRNPDPTYQSETELGYSYTINKRLASGDLWFPDNDLKLLRCNKGQAKPVIMSLACGWGRPRADRSA